jgi:hypothetical protein
MSGASLPDRPMLAALAATGPDPDHAEELMLFGQFVGSWEFACIEYEPDGRSRNEPGERHFGWTLEGRAVQDVWILPARAARSSGARRSNGARRCVSTTPRSALGM